MLEMSSDFYIISLVIAFLLGGASVYLAQNSHTEDK